MDRGIYKFYSHLRFPSKIMPMPVDKVHGDVPCEVKTSTHSPFDGIVDSIVLGDENSGFDQLCSCIIEEH